MQKLIARAGIASRRAAEELIRSGRVRLNGRVVTELGTCADPSRDRIEVDGQLLPIAQPPVYLVINKPAGYITTRQDPHAPRTVMSLLPERYQSLHPAGRLDKDTEGLLLLTNDGALTFALTHPRHAVEKEYEARVRGVPDPVALSQLREGVNLDDGLTAPAEATVLRGEGETTTLRLVLREGRKRQVRRMLGAIGFPVVTLKRVRVGNLRLGPLRPGQWRLLKEEEARKLRREPKGARPVPCRRAGSTGQRPV